MRFKREIAVRGECDAAQCRAQAEVILALPGDMRRGLCSQHWQQHCLETDEVILAQARATISDDPVQLDFWLESNNQRRT